MQFVILAFALFACGSPKAPVSTAGSGSGAAPPAEKVLVNANADGVVLEGHDPVSYRDGAPAMGAAEHHAEYGGGTYRFASADHKAAFERDGKASAPAFGGYCAFAASQNRLSPSDPKVFLVLDGQLLVFTNQDFLDQFKKDPAGNKAKADANWPGLVAKHGKPR
jgi:YHS domain-containing protein